ncbi:unnamed protein product, partial [Durusdinium trenchii]
MTCLSKSWLFRPRESRELGRGWQVLRVRENTWAEQQGVQPGDELHYIEGHPIEVLPEAEVMELLQQRPVRLTWYRRKAGHSAEEPEAETAVPLAKVDSEVDELKAQNRALEEQLSRLSIELGKEQFNAGSKDPQEILQLQAQLSAAVSRVAELEAEAAQDEPLAPEEQPNGSKDMEEITQLQAQLAASRARVAELEAQERAPAGSKESEIVQLQAQLSAAVARVAELEAEDEPLAPEEHLAAPDGSWEEEKKDLEQQLEARRGHIDQLETEVEQLKLQTKEEKKDLEQQLESRRGRIDQLETEVEHLELQMKEHKASESKESEEIVQLQAKLSAAHTRVAELEAQAAQDQSLAPK